MGRLGATLNGQTTTPATGRGRGRLAVGDERHLWALVGLEVLAMMALRRKFRGRHGG